MVRSKKTPPSFSMTLRSGGRSGNSGAMLRSLAPSEISGLCPPSKRVSTIDQDTVEIDMGVDVGQISNLLPTPPQNDIASVVPSPSQQVVNPLALMSPPPNGVSVYAHAASKVIGNPEQAHILALALAMNNGISSQVSLDDISHAVDINQLHVRDGGRGNPTPIEIVEWSRKRLYPAREISSVHITVTPSIIGTEGRAHLCSSRTYPARMCQTLRQLKQAARPDWKSHFAFVGITKTEILRLSDSSIEVRVTDSHSPIGAWDDYRPVNSHEDYAEWFNKNATCGRAERLSLTMAFDLLPSDAFLTAAGANQHRWKISDGSNLP